MLSDEEVMRAVYAIGKKRKNRAKEGSGTVEAGGHTKKKRKKGAEGTPEVPKEGANSGSRWPHLKEMKEGCRSNPEVAKEGADTVEAGGHTKKKQKK